MDRLSYSYQSSEKVNKEMSICIVLGVMLGRGIQTLYVDMKKKRETKQQQKRERRRLSEQSRGSAGLQTLVQPDRGEYQHLRDSGHDHHDERDNLPVSSRTRPLQRMDREDMPPTYDHCTGVLPPYDHTLPNPTAIPHRGRREGRDEISARPRARACTGIRIREPDVDQTVIWYDALEDRYEVISRLLGPCIELPVPPPYR